MNPLPSKDTIRPILYQYKNRYRGYKTILTLSLLAMLIVAPIAGDLIQILQQSVSAHSMKSGLSVNLTPSDMLLHSKPTLSMLATSVANKQGMDPNLVKSIISVESSWNPSALSSKGAIGLMQVHHPTWKERWTKKELLDPEKNLFAGTTILKNMLNTSTNLEEALHKYSGGIKDYAKKVRKGMRR